MFDRSASRRSCHSQGVAVSLSVALFASLACTFGQTPCPDDGCSGGPGTWLVNCPQVGDPLLSKFLICNAGPVVEDSCFQKESSIAMVAQGCLVTLAGTWMDLAQTVGTSENPWHLALSLSEEGLGWWPPGEVTAECNPYPDPRRFLNDCYFAACIHAPAEPPPCSTQPATLLGCTRWPNICSGHSIDPTTWRAFDEAICAGANGALYIAASSSYSDPVGAGFNELLFTRSEDRGATFCVLPSPCTPDPGSDYPRLKHICPSPASNYDRVGAAASPNPSSDEVFVYWNDAHLRVLVLRSPNAGDNFYGDSTIPGQPPIENQPNLLQSVVSPEEVFAPEGAMAHDGSFYQVWADVVDRTNPSKPTRIRMRARTTSGTWDPPLAEDPRSISGSDPFPGRRDYGPYAEYSAPSIAVDTTLNPDTLEPGPHFGWLYAAYAVRGVIGDPDNPWSRIKFVRSCNGGHDWSLPCAISPDEGHANSVQFYPRVRVDGRGNVGVSWYDTRYNNGTDPQRPRYDIYFAFSPDGRSTWHEQRVTGVGDSPFFYPDQEQTGKGPAEYSGMTADPRPGTSTFYVLAMGTPAGGTSQDIYFYQINPRLLGDVEGDFDVDGEDGLWNTCFGYPWEWGRCSCDLLDLDQDGDVDTTDFECFYNTDPENPSCPVVYWTDTLCECHGPCQDDPGCTAEGSGAGSGCLGEGLPPECAFAAPYLNHATEKDVYEFQDRLEVYVSEHPDAPDAPRALQLLDCLRSALP